jgi:hypothetical protein
VSEHTPERLTRAELEAEAGTALPAKEVISLLDLNVDVDLALALAAPIDLAVAANAQAALPIDAAVSANILSFFSSAGAVANQGVMIDQVMTGVVAEADAPQTAVIDQTGDSGDEGETGSFGTQSLEDTTDTVGDTVEDTTDVVDDTTDAVDDVTDGLDGTIDDVTGEVTDAIGDAAGDLGSSLDGALQDGLLNVDVKVALDADLAAPIAGAVAANAQIAAPIDAAVAANIGSIGSEALAVADQTAIITQSMEDVSATATADQDAEISQ